MNGDNQTPIHCDPTKRHEFVLLFEVKDGNPNGNPDAGNLPRIDPETGHGIVTDVSVKRKVRDYVQRELRKDIFIQSEFALNSLIDQAAVDEGIERPYYTVEDADLSEWLKNSSIEDLQQDSGNSFRFAGVNFNKQAFTKTLKDLYVTQVQAVEDSIKELAKALDKQDKVAIENQELIDFLTEREPPVQLEEGFVSIKPDKSPKDLLQLCDEFEDMKRKIGKFASEIGKAAKGALKKDEREIVRKHLTDQYFDIKMFGAVLSTGINAGQVRGPMQIKFGRSIDRVVPLDHSITRCAITRSEDLLRKETEMARKPNIPYGLYRVHGYYNPSLACRKELVEGEKDKHEWKPFVTTDDLKDFWEALENMYEKHSASSAAAGEQATRGLWVFSHDTAKGNAHAHRLFELIKIAAFGDDGEPRSFEQYESRMEFPGKSNKPEEAHKIGEAKPLSDFPGVSITRLV